MNEQRPQKTEHAEPHEQYNPVPAALIGLVLGLVVWAASYIATASANGAAALGDGRDIAALTAGATNDVVDGAALYTNNCQSCHQPTGAGLAGVFPPLAGSDWVVDDDATLTQIILHGLTGPITVLGTTYNGAMPGFAGQLSDAEIAALASHIRSAWGNAAPSVETAAVAAARAASKDRTTPWQGAEELRAFAASQRGQ